MMEEAEGVLKRGVRIVKQILMAGLLASSAPVVVPPLVAVSVIGISVSIPFGLFLASHACTHKLMSKLLPMPMPANHTRMGIGIMGENEAADDQRIERRDIVDSHKLIPSVVTADETIGLRQECCSAVDVPNSTRSPNNDEVTVNEEEELWKEMNAIRVIVGYEGTPQASCADELKRLYILAGVEPPRLLSSNEFHNRLHFLMSILGVESHGP